MQPGQSGVSFFWSDLPSMNAISIADFCREQKFRLVGITLATFT